MKLAHRLNVTVILATGIALLLSAALTRYIVLGSFEAQERLTNDADVARIEAALESERRRLFGLVADWAEWDDTYTFMDDRNRAFIRSNLVDEIFNNPAIGLDVTLFLDAQGELWHAAGAAWAVGPGSTFSDDLATLVASNGADARPATGFARLGKTDPPFVYATHPIHRSDGSGQRRGTMVMVRCINDILVAQLSEMVQYDLTLVPPTSVTAVTSTVDRATRETRVPVLTAAGEPIAALRFTADRTAYLRGERTALVVLASAVALILGVAVVIQRLMQNTLVRRIERIVETVSRIGETGDLSIRLTARGDDEISRLAEQTNSMLDRLQTQEVAVRHLERHEAHHQMSAGINHNLNNLLTGVVGGADLLLRSSDNATVRQRAQGILSAGQQAGDLVARLNSLFGTAGSETLEPVDLNQVVRRVVEDSAPRWRDGAQAEGVTITVVEQLEIALPPVQGVASSLYNAVLNLVLNAVNAMPRGGRLTLITRLRGDLIELSVGDEGIGMDATTRRQIFDPFFSTSPDIGRGLGLATVMSAMVRCGGSVEVVSAPGQGAEFRLRFQVSEQALPATNHPPPPAAPRRGRILVVDDQTYIGELLQELLSTDHEVVVFADAEQAAASLASGPWDIAILDLAMPGIPGDELARRLRQAWPNAVLVLMTGWDLPKRDPRLSPFDHVLRKPVHSLAELESLVVRALSGNWQPQVAEPT